MGRRAALCKVPSAELLAKEARALELRRLRVSYADIAAELGYSNKGSAYKAVQRAISRTHKESVDELRSLELDMFDQLQREWWPRRQTIDGTKAILAVSDRRARIAGLNAPTQNTLTVSVDERTAALVVSVLSAILSDLKLTPEQEVLAGEVVPRHLQALDAPQAG